MHVLENFLKGPIIIGHNVKNKRLDRENKAVLQIQP